MGIMCSLVSGKHLSVDCVHYFGPDVSAKSPLRGSVILTVSVDEGQVTLHLTPESAARVETALGQCLQDMHAVINAKAKADEVVRLDSADAVDQRISNGMTDADRKKMDELGGSVGY